MKNIKSLLISLVLDKYFLSEEFTSDDISDNDSDSDSDSSSGSSTPPNTLKSPSN